MKNMEKTLETTAIVYVESLEQARNELYKFIGKEITLRNCPGSIYYLGIKTIDYMFKLLSNEFSISSTIIDVEDDHAAAISALKLGYENIMYHGDSVEIKKLLGY
ncbi:MAG: hypothetical protein K0Q51_99 [Rickettsiaceae bacterium]|jgi:hypothetical protein|nr:hypothetical protein [Rickettsiaceae bacterium]